MKKCLIDTNIFLDFILKREPFFIESKKTLLAMEFIKELNGVVSSSIITDIYYIAKKSLSDEEIKDFLLHLLTFIDVIDIDNETIRTALLSEFKDFEDAFQNFTAVAANCNYIITRNKDDYYESSLEILTPKEFILKIKN